MKLGDLASRLGAELRGDAELEVTGVRVIEEAGPTEVTFVANPRYTSLARKTKAAAVLVDPEFQEIEAATLRIKNPYLAFSRALGLFYQPPAYPPGIHPTAVIDPTSVIGEGAHIGAYVVVGPDVQLGAHATLLPHVVLYPGVKAGSHLFAHAHAMVRLLVRTGLALRGRRRGIGKRFRSRGLSGWGIASMCKPTPALTVRQLGRPRSAMEAKSTTWSRSGMDPKLGRTRWCARRRDWLGPR